LLSKPNVTIQGCGFQIIHIGSGSGFIIHFGSRWKIITDPI
jgi:hypothetical protein